MTTPAEPMSDERIAEIRAREQATIPGPWFVVDDQSGTLERWINSEDGTLEVGLGYLGNRTEDEAAFIAHARQDIPDLLNEVDRLRAMEQRVRDLHPKRENPRYGCCGGYKICTEPHPPVCWGASHGLNKPDWPCREIAALDGTGAGR